MAMGGQQLICPKKIASIEMWLKDECEYVKKIISLTEIFVKKSGSYIPKICKKNACNEQPLHNF